MNNTDEKLLNEIFDQFIGCGKPPEECDCDVCGMNPSKALLDKLADTFGITSAIVEDHFSARYRRITGRSDGPFEPTIPIMG